MVRSSLLRGRRKTPTSVTGAISDSSHSKYRRRYWVVLSTVALVVSTAALAYCDSMAAFFVDLFGGGAGDWDPERQKQVCRRLSKDMLALTSHS